MATIVSKTVFLLQLMHAVFAMNQEGSSSNDVESSPASRPRSSSKESISSSIFSKVSNAISSRLLNDSDYDAKGTTLGGNTESISASLLYGLGLRSNASSSSTPQLGIFQVFIYCRKNVLETYNSIWGYFHCIGSLGPFSL